MGQLFWIFLPSYIASVHTHTGVNMCVDTHARMRACVKGTLWEPCTGDACSECLTSYSSNPSIHPSISSHLPLLPAAHLPSHLPLLNGFISQGLQESAGFAAAAAFPGAMLQCYRLTLLFLPPSLSLFTQSKCR